MKMSRYMALSTTVLVAFFMAALARGEHPAERLCAPEPNLGLGAYRRQKHDQHF